MKTKEVEVVLANETIVDNNELFKILLLTTDIKWNGFQIYLT